MPIRAIVIMFVAAVVLAVCYREPIYKWITGSLGKKQGKNTDGESEEEKENGD